MNQTPKDPNIEVQDEPTSATEELLVGIFQLFFWIPIAGMVVADECSNRLLTSKLGEHRPWWL